VDVKRGKKEAQKKRLPNSGESPRGEQLGGTFGEGCQVEKKKGQFTAKRGGALAGWEKHTYTGAGVFWWTINMDPKGWQDQSKEKMRAGDLYGQRVEGYGLARLKRGE